jgi:predicted KAP-like P-loop ATPase
LSNYDDSYQKGLIITDDISFDPILDFNLYRNAIVNIIKNSYPKFTIGIFGDWGTGKTTLMNAINESLEESDKNIVRVRFETWRYEREEQFALVPLLKTIAFALPDDEKFRPLKEKLKRGAINFLKRTPEILSSLISKYINEDVGTITKEAFDSFKKEFNSKMELLAEIDRDTLYFDGFDHIRKEINKIQKNNPNFKIVVFIDDLDRCSPKKTLEVLESIKVFLGMEGFIYIIGLSHDIVTKLIDIEYEKKGVKGEQYIKKIIQIPITLPDWNKNDIKKLLEDFISKEIIHKEYQTIINENIDLIVTAVEENPRETKRFLNNFIVAYEIYSKSGVKLNELLILQTLNMRWNEIYKLLINSDGLYLKKNLYMDLLQFFIIIISIILLVVVIDLFQIILFYLYFHNPF